MHRPSQLEPVAFDGVAEAPLVSVVVPAYKHERYVGKALESVLSQSLTNIEVIVIDDASPDGTWNAIQAFRDSRLRPSRNVVNQGASSTLNSAIQRCRGTYIAILNSDDVFHVDRLATLVSRLEAEQWDLVGSGIDLIDGAGLVIEDARHWWVEWYVGLVDGLASRGDIVDALLSGNLFITTSNFVFRRSLVERIGLFSNERYVHDYEFLLRCCATPEVKIGLLPELKLLQYRLHVSNTIKENALKANHETMDLMRRYAPRLMPGAEIRGRLVVEHLLTLSGHVEWILSHELSEVQRRSLCVRLTSSLRGALRAGNNLVRGWGEHGRR